MLKSQLLHPEILASLASAGHGSKVLIADSNYPFRTHINSAADLVFLNLAPGRLNVVEVLEVLLGAVPVEAAEVIFPEDGVEPSIHAEFRTALGDVETRPLGRRAFYDQARSQDLALAIATGEQRTYACLILTIGVIG